MYAVSYQKAIPHLYSNVWRVLLCLSGGTRTVSRRWTRYIYHPPYIAILRGSLLTLPLSTPLLSPPFLPLHPPLFYFQLSILFSHLLHVFPSPSSPLLLPPSTLPLHPPLSTLPLPAEALYDASRLADTDGAPQRALLDGAT